jgi:hypothetical protein
MSWSIDPVMAAGNQRAGQPSRHYCRARESLGVVRVLRLALLAPAVVEAALDGTLKAGVDGTALLQTDAIPLDWNEQAKQFVAG